MLDAISCLADNPDEKEDDEDEGSTKTTTLEAEISVVGRVQE
jgi:hypothetical protein